jgi:hypothetical protein
MGEIAQKDQQLLQAVSKPSKKCEIRALIAGGADPTVIDPVSGLRPIHIAARDGNMNALKALLEDDRVHADCVDPRGKVPYEWADEFKHARAEAFLLNTIFENPSRYSRQSVREARHHLRVKSEAVPA